jgi:hypothetical protein
LPAARRSGKPTSQQNAYFWPCAAEADLAKIAAAVHRPKRPLRGKDRIGLKVGRVIDRHNGQARRFENLRLRVHL